jgi:hypothetical protein
MRLYSGSCCSPSGELLQYQIKVLHSSHFLALHETFYEECDSLATYILLPASNLISVHHVDLNEPKRRVAHNQAAQRTEPPDSNPTASCPRPFVTPTTNAIVLQPQSPMPAHGPNYHSALRCKISHPSLSCGSGQGIAGHCPKTCWFAQRHRAHLLLVSVHPRHRVRLSQVRPVV